MDIATSDGLRVAAAMGDYGCLHGAGDECRRKKGGTR